MLRFLLSSTLLCYVLNTATIADATAIAPYCAVNETITKTRPVLKTRKVERKPTGWLKTFKKSKIITEEYVDYEVYTTLKVKHVCCEGFKISELLRICEPVCEGEHKCPENAICFEPNRCKCRDGYGTIIADVDEKQMICEPICLESCPENGRCAKPNICECERGYRAEAGKCMAHCSSGCPHEGRCVRPEVCECEKSYLASGGTCTPICERGQGCRNGKCIDTEECVCNIGYKKNPRTEVCEAMPCAEGERNCIADEDNNSETSTVESFDTSETAEAEAVDENDNGLDENEKIYLNTPNTLDGTISAAYTEICPPNFIYYNGQCREAININEETDCRLKPCMDNAICQTNGICACAEGYTWYSPVITGTIKQNTVTTETAVERSEEASVEYSEMESTDSTETTESIATPSGEIIEMVPICISVQEFNALMETDEAKDDDGSMGICFIALGVACMLCAAIFLIIKLLRHQRGHMTVGAKNDLCCEYDNKSFNERQMVL